MKNTADFPAALWQEIENRWQEFQRGIQKYHRHDFTRAANPFPAVWERGTTRLYDYGGAGVPLLIVPSLVNRAYILDLLPEKSFLKFLSARGFHPFLVDWQAPGAAEKDFGLADYITDRLLPAYEFICQNYCEPAPAKAGGAPSVMGYCMGGNLALALAQLARPKPKSLILMATPWDFQAAGMPRFTEDMAKQLLQMVSHHGELPVDFLQSFFTALDPFGSVQKFMKFAGMEDDSEAARLFVALEDWLSDGVPLTAPVARDTMQDWYARNTPARGEWRIFDTLIDPAQIQIPTLAILPQQDRIVSPASAAALAARIPGALSLTPDLGHIGMMVSREAEIKVWEPVAGWLNNKL